MLDCSGGPQPVQLQLRRRRLAAAVSPSRLLAVSLTSDSQDLKQQKFTLDVEPTDLVRRRRSCLQTAHTVSLGPRELDADME